MKILERSYKDELFWINDDVQRIIKEENMLIGREHWVAVNCSDSSQFMERESNYRMKFAQESGLFPEE